MRPGLSRAARPVGVPGRLAFACGSRGTRTHERLAPPPVFKTGPSSGRMASDGLASSGGWNRTSGLRVQSAASLPAATAPECIYIERWFGKEDSNLHGPDSKSGGLPISRFPRASCGSRTHLSGLGSPCLAARPRTRSFIRSFVRVRDRGVEPRSPGWRPGVLPIDQSRASPPRRKERESNPQGSRSPDFESGAVAHRLALPRWNQR
jgi:hypothetical protein